MGHAAEQLQRHLPACGTQSVGVSDALVHQRITFGQHQTGWGRAAVVVGIQWRETPIAALCGVDVMTEKPGNRRRIEQVPFRKLPVRGRVGMGGGAGGNQQLQRKLEA